MNLSLWWAFFVNLICWNLPEASVAKVTERNDSNKKTGPDALRVISVSDPVFSMVFPMNSWAGLSSRFLILFYWHRLLFNVTIPSRNGFVTVRLLPKRGARFFFYFFLIWTNLRTFAKWFIQNGLLASFVLTFQHYQVTINIKKWVLLLSKVIWLEKVARFFFYFHDIV